MTISREVDTKKKIAYGKKNFLKELKETRNQLNAIERDGIDVKRYRDKLDAIESESQQSDDWMKLRDRLRQFRREQEDFSNATEWERLEKELRESFDLLERTNDKLGNEKSSQMVNQFRTQVEQAIQSKNVSIGHELVNQMDALQYHLARVYYYMRWIDDWNHRFGHFNWKNPGRARDLLNQGNSIIANQPTAEKLQPIIREIVNLLPDDEKPDDGGGRLG